VHNPPEGDGRSLKKSAHLDLEDGTVASSLAGRDVLRGDDLTVDEVELVMKTASRFEAVTQSGGRLLNMDGRVLVTLFYEPSTRTRLSFETAMLRLGGRVVSVAEAKSSSSAAKGETLFDTGKMIDGYADVAVIRHPVVGSARELAEGATIPVLNGGDGAGQHPTQALLDLYTIRKERGRVEGLTIALVGDLKNGRTVHSLAALLANFGVGFYFVAPEELRMPREVCDGLRQRGLDVVETEDLAGAIAKSDIVYMTRIQRERFATPADYERLKGAYVLNRTLVEGVNPNVTILHPLPRVDEIDTDLDTYEGAAYFREAANGVPVRMALMTLVTGSE
jgi:aspartate carbamoyltransferase catalytic subunit